MTYPSTPASGKGGASGGMLEFGGHSWPQFWSQVGVRRRDGVVAVGGLRRMVRAGWGCAPAHLGLDFVKRCSLP